MIYYVAPPEIIMGPTHKTALVGDRLELTCEAVGTPKPSITWFKDDINIELNQRIEVRLYFMVQNCVVLHD